LFSAGPVLAWVVFWWNEGQFLRGTSFNIASNVMMRASIFGEFRLATAQSNPVELNNHRGNLILAILCLQPDLSIDRSQLAQLLWPDRFAPQAKASLRQCLHDLKRQLAHNEFAGLVVTRTSVSLSPETIASDLLDLEMALANRDLDICAELLLEAGNRPLLQGTTLNPVFDDWLIARREHIDARLRTALLKFQNEAASTADSAAFRGLREAAGVRFPERGHITNALNNISLAVLPFETRDELGEDFFLADGAVDELSAQLGRIHGVSLVGRTSVLAVSRRKNTLPNMAAELRATHLVEGEVRRNAERIEIRLALIEGASGTELWSERIVASTEDFITSRKVFGANVIAAICNVLGLPQSATPARRMTTSREAYALYLQGRAMLQRSMAEGAVAKAIELLERALEIDPEFAECWTALADAQISTAVFTPCLDRVERSAKAARCASRAITLDPGQAHALSLQGIHEWTCRRPAAALDLSFEAYRRDPNDPDVASRLGACLLYLGRTREAVPFIEASVDRDPIYGRNYVMLLSAYFALGDLDRALAAGERMVDLGYPEMWLAVVQASMGQHEQAIENYKSSRFHLGKTIMRPPGVEPMDDRARDAYFTIAAKGCCSGNAEDRAFYCQMLDGLHQTMPDPYDPSIALPAIWMGHAELVMKIYSECIHPANMFGLSSLWVDSDPINRIRRHPDFMQFATEIGMVEAWNRFGWPDVMPSDPRSN
jgi:TolB-like protein/Flp pilus assembly protein TadD